MDHGAGVEHRVIGEDQRGGSQSAHLTRSRRDDEAGTREELLERTRIDGAQLRGREEVHPRNPQRNIEKTRPMTPPCSCFSICSISPASRNTPPQLAHWSTLTPWSSISLRSMPHFGHFIQWSCLS